MVDIISKLLSFLNPPLNKEITDRLEPLCNLLLKWAGYFLKIIQCIKNTTFFGPKFILFMAMTTELPSDFFLFLD